MEFPTVNVGASQRSLGKLKKGLMVRLKGGLMPLIIHPERFDHISRCILKGKGFQLALSPEEIHHNHARGIFGKKADKWMEKKGIKKGVYAVGTALKPLAQQAISAGTQALGDAAMAYAPEFAPEIQMAQKYANNHAQQYIDDPSRKQAQIKAAYSNYKNAPPSRTSPLDAINAMTGQNMGSLDRASIGQAAANYGLGQMAQAVAAKQASMLPVSATTDTPVGSWGHGLGLYGYGMRHHHHHREKDSIGVMGNLLHTQGGALHPALMSQPYGANFQFRTHLPPAYAAMSKAGGLY